MSMRWVIGITWLGGALFVAGAVLNILEWICLGLGMMAPFISHECWKDIRRIFK